MPNSLRVWKIGEIVAAKVLEGPPSVNFDSPRPPLLPAHDCGFWPRWLLLDFVCFLFGRRRYVSQSFKKLVPSRSRPGRPLPEPSSSAQNFLCHICVAVGVRLVLI